MRTMIKFKYNLIKITRNGNSLRENADILLKTRRALCLGCAVLLVGTFPAGPSLAQGEKNGSISSFSTAVPTGVLDDILGQIRGGTLSLSQATARVSGMSDLSPDMVQSGLQASLSGQLSTSQLGQTFSLARSGINGASGVADDIFGLANQGQGAISGGAIDFLSSQGGGLTSGALSFASQTLDLSSIDPGAAASLFNAGINGTSLQTLGNITSQIDAGSLTGGLQDSVLSAIQGGPLNAGQIGDFLSGQGFQSAFGDLSSLANFNPQQALGVVTNVGDLLGGGLMDPSALAGRIAEAFPGLADAFGGIGGLTSEVAGMIGADSLLGGGLGSGIMSALGLDSLPIAAALPGITAGGCECEAAAAQEEDRTKEHTENEFIRHRRWLATTFFREHIVPALKRMTQQLTAVGMQQMQIVGTMFDAKQQLENQRLFQQLQAEAHKNYHPSEGMCEIGTITRSLASSEQSARLAASVIAARGLQRELRSGKNLSTGDASDKDSRLDQYLKVYCNPADQGNGLVKLCASGGDNKRRNKDVDYTRTIEAPLTLKMDFTGEGDSSRDATRKASVDEEDVFALAANLFAHEVPKIDKALANKLNEADPVSTSRYMDLRSVAAKRSVAQDSFAAIVGMRAQGAPEVAQYMKEILKGLGIPEEDIDQILGPRPSYFAQMEVLTKKIYQNPSFYTELYDQPANVERKGAALQAIGLMQDRDIYLSLLRSEAVLSLMLESQLMRQQRAINPRLKSSRSTGATDGGD